MKYIIQNFDTIIGESCIITALSNISRYNGCMYTDAELFFLCNELNVQYEYDINYISSRVMRNMPELERATGIQVNFWDINLDKWHVEDMYKIITQNKPMILFTNTSKLTYSPVYLNNKNRYHAIILYGLDLENNEAFISDAHFHDPSGKIKQVRGTITIDDMMEATYRAAWFDFSNDCKLSKEQLIFVVRDRLQDFMRGNKSDSIAYGVSALKEFIGDLNKLETISDSEIEDTCTNINYIIKICSFNYINTYIIDYLKQLYSIININTAELVTNYYNIEQEWTKLAFSFLKLGKSKRRENIPKLIEKSNLLLQLQIELYQNFELVIAERGKG